MAEFGDDTDVDTLNISGSEFISSGDFVAIGASYSTPSEANAISTASSSYQGKSDYCKFKIIWDDAVPTNADTAILSQVQKGGSGTADVRLRNTTDGETVWEETGLAFGSQVSRIDNYSPSTTGSRVTFEIQIKSTDGATVLARSYSINFGVQL